MNPKPTDPITAAILALQASNELAAANAKIKNLKAEVAELRKAGDELCWRMQSRLLTVTDGDTADAVNNWLRILETP